MEGDRWAVKFVTDRLFGRTPVEVEVTTTQLQTSIVDLTTEELMARMDRLRTLLELNADPKADVVVIDEPEATDAPQG
jgi:hypothetical protein